MVNFHYKYGRAGFILGLLWVKEVVMHAFMELNFKHITADLCPLHDNTGHSAETTQQGHNQVTPRRYTTTTTTTTTATQGIFWAPETSKLSFSMP